MNRKLVKVNLWGRGFDLDSLFIVSPAGWARIEHWCREEKEVHLGEIAGKHSDVSVTFDLDDFKVITEDEAFIAQFETIIGKSVGLNILEYMHDRCEECGEGIYGERSEDLCDYCQEQLDIAEAGE